jgi:hypothetical protein
LDERFVTAGNADVLAFIARANPSAHSDVASVLCASANGLSGVAWYCPDKHAYAYVALHTRDSRIFAIACGMDGLAYRLPSGMIPVALEQGACRCPEIGADWVWLPPWQAGTPGASGPDLRYWCKTAHDHVAGI